MSFKKYADIVIGLKYTGNSEVFCYAIPDQLIGKVSEGVRVLVPFGMGNKVYEGYVIGMRDNIDDINIKEVKEIISVTDEMPLLLPFSIKLAKWISKKYLCSLNEAIMLMLPSCIKIKSDKHVKFLSIDKNKFDKFNEQDKGVIKYLIKKKEPVSIKTITRETGFKDIDRILYKLKEEGIIDFFYKTFQKTKNKYIEVVELTDDACEQDISSRANVQRRIFDILKKHKMLSKRQLREIVGSSVYSSLNSMIKKGLVNVEKVNVERDPFLGISYERDLPKRPTCQQKHIIDGIASQLDKGRCNKYLIHGVTGSGKTEIYLQTIQQAINNNKQVIVLVPEISLTPQMITQFRSRFGDIVGVIHSALSEGEKYDQWEKIRTGEVSIVIGARSAIFVPFDKLGMIIIDEEHENTYKSSTNPRYDAIEVAEKRAEMQNAVLVLGSATPSLESYYKSLKGEYTLFKLDKRINGRSMPHVDVVDMREELKAGNRSIFSSKLYYNIQDRLERKEQVILFLNRRGYSTFVSCRKCGYVMKCKNCDITLTYHNDTRKVECHYCGYTANSPRVCPQCKSNYIKYFGIGTQKVEEFTANAFKDARIARMDVDTTRGKGAHNKILSKFRRGEIDILIGTQMISKGLDFPNVTLVGVIAADVSINLPDFRSAERTFQLITQVAGRAGRGFKKGEVIVQTYQPDHYSLKAATDHDYEKFYSQEIVYREAFKYPPFMEIINIIVRGKDERCVIDVIQEVYKILNSFFKYLTGKDDIIILGPSVAPIPKIKGMYRWQILIKTNDINNSLEVLRKISDKYFNYYKKKGVFINIDINPQNIM